MRQWTCWRRFLHPLRYGACRHDPDGGRGLLTALEILVPGFTVVSESTWRRAITSFDDMFRANLRIHQRPQVPTFGTCGGVLFMVSFCTWPRRSRRDRANPHFSANTFHDPDSGEYNEAGISFPIHLLHFFISCERTRKEESAQVSRDGRGRTRGFKV